MTLYIGGWDKVEKDYSKAVPISQTLPKRGRAGSMGVIRPECVKLLLWFFF